jgi:hypothetical protein
LRIVIDNKENNIARLSITQNAATHPSITNDQTVNRSIPRLKIQR